ncbi:MAG: helix-turn-helix domain-containing protein [Rhizomicrobium sp.]
MDMRKLVGQNVQRIRRKKRLTQEQFAERSGFSQQYLSDLENGKRNPTIITLYELATALGVNHIELLGVTVELDGEAGKRSGRGRLKSKR